MMMLWLCYVFPAKRGSNVLLYANVTLIDDCKKFYKDRFKPGMMCAGRAHLLLNTS